MSLTSILHAGPVLFFGVAHLPSLVYAFRAVQDAHCLLLGRKAFHGAAVVDSMDSQRDALLAMTRILKPLKVI